MSQTGIFTDYLIDLNYFWSLLIVRFGSVWFGFMAYQPLLVIKCHIYFYTYKQFYFKQTILNKAYVHSLNVKTVLFQAI